MAHKIKTGMLYRAFGIDKSSIDEAKRSIELSFSSEIPVQRYFGSEILSHENGAIRLDRLKNAAPLLLEHCREDQIGVVEGVTVTADKKGRALVRFGKGGKAEEVYQDILDGIRQNVSVGYVVHKMACDDTEAASPVYRAIDWEPLEISIVSVPADPTVGIGRSDGKENFETEIITKTERKEKMETTTTPAVDVRAIENDVRTKELSRIKEISVIAENQKMQEIGRQFIESGKSVDAFRAAVLDELEKRTVIKPVAKTEALPEKEVKNFSLMRAMAALANPTDRQAQEAAAFEFELSREAARAAGKTPKGFYVPTEVLQRDLTVGTANAGGYTKQTTVLGGSFIDILRNKMMVAKMGATVLSGLVGDIAIPSQTGGATSYWVAESGAPTESQQTFGQVTLSPKTVGAFTDISRKLLLQSSIDVESLVTRDLATTIALAIDAAALHGTAASNQPRGIAATSGIGSVAGGTNGAAPTYANIIDLWTQLSQDNADLGALGFLTNSKVIGKLMSTQKVATYGNDFVVNNFPDANGFTTLGGFRCGVSNQVSSTLDKGTTTGACSAIFYGNWADLLIGQWSGLDLLVDPYTGGAAGTVRVRVLQDVDIAVRHAESFSAMLDALTA